MNQATDISIRHRFDNRLIELKRLVEISDSKTYASRYQRLATQAGHLHFHDVCMECYEYLHKYYSVVSKNGYRFNQVNEKLKFHESLVLKERELRNKTIEVENKFQFTRTFSELDYTELERFIDQVDLKIEHGPYVYQKYYYLKNLLLSLKEDFHGVIENGIEAYEFFEEQFIKMNNSKMKYLVRVAGAYISLKEYSKAMSFIDICEDIEADNQVEIHNFKLIKSRIMLSQGIDTYDVLDDWSEEEVQDHQNLTRHLILCYNDLINGRAVTDFSVFNRYRKDPKGLGISVAIAKIWSLRIQEDHFQHYRDIKKLCSRNLKEDPRSRMMIEFIAGVKAYKESDLSAHPYNAEIEIIPFELIHKQVSRL